MAPATRAKADQTKAAPSGNKSRTTKAKESTKPASSKTRKTDAKSEAGPATSKKRKADAKSESADPASKKRKADDEDELDSAASKKQKVSQANGASRKPKVAADKEQSEFAVPEKRKAAAPTTTRAGRAVKKPPVDENFLFGSELDRQLMSTPLTNNNNRHLHQAVVLSSPYGEVPSSPPVFTRATQHDSSSQRGSPNGEQAEPTKIVEVAEPTPAQPLEGTQTAKSVEPLIPEPKDSAAGAKDAPVEEDIEGLEASTAPSSADSEQLFDAATFGYPENTDNVIKFLSEHDKVQIDLPEIADSANPDVEVPYTAEFLTQLYIISYKQKQWNICDVIADTWVRAFHQARKNAEDDPHARIWRTNHALEGRMKVTQQNPKPQPFDEGAPDYGLDAVDPELDPRVTSFNIDVLNLLYISTNANCGARLLWADAMALAGSRTDRLMQRARRDGRIVHSDLVHDIMCTTLRLVRRKLTLKIEEDTEQAWCERYHEHTKHDQPCYRELAFKEGQGKDPNAGAEAD